MTGTGVGGALAAPAVAITKDVASAGVGGAAVAGVVGALTLGAGMLAYHAASHYEKTSEANLASRSAAAVALANRVGGSKRVTTADVAAVEAALREQQKIQSEEERIAAHGAGWSPWTGYWRSGERKDAAAKEAHDAAVAVDALTKALNAATPALAKLGATASNIDPNRSLPIPQRAVQ